MYFFFFFYTRSERSLPSKKLRGQNDADTNRDLFHSFLSNSFGSQHSSRVRALLDQLQTWVWTLVGPKGHPAEFHFCPEISLSKKLRTILKIISPNLQTRALFSVEIVGPSLLQWGGWGGEVCPLPRKQQRGQCDSFWPLPFQLHGLKVTEEPMYRKLIAIENKLFAPSETWLFFHFQWVGSVLVSVKAALISAARFQQCGLNLKWKGGNFFQVERSGWLFRMSLSGSRHLWEGVCSSSAKEEEAFLRLKTMPEKTSWCPPPKKNYLPNSTVKTSMLVNVKAECPRPSITWQCNAGPNSPLARGPHDDTHDSIRPSRLCRVTRLHPTGWKSTIIIQMSSFVLQTWIQWDYSGKGGKKTHLNKEFAKSSFRIFPPDTLSGVGVWVPLFARKWGLLPCLSHSFVQTGKHSTAGEMACHFCLLHLHHSSKTEQDCCWLFHSLWYQLP